MSKVAIKGNISGTGVFSIEAPATNTDRTLMLPDAGGTLLVSGAKIATGDVAITGYINVLDSNGNTIKLAVVA